jgi:putative transferase (TIGR04331 family)
MSKKKYNLIFSNKNKFSKKYKNILTGRWILKFNQEIKNSNIEIYKYHWLDKKEKVKDFIYTQKVYKRVLKKLIPILNNFHSKKFSGKHWEVLIFYFLEFYIFLIYDRWKMINNIKKKYKLNKVEIFSFKKNNFIPLDTEEAIYFARTDEWNNWIFFEIIKNLKLDFTEKTLNTNINKVKKKSNLKKLKFQKLFTPQNNQKYFLKNLNFSRYYKFRLNFKLGQMVKTYNDLVIEDNKKISYTRRIFKSLQSNDQFEQFIYKIMPSILPRSFLENYKKIEQNLKFLNWPINPKIIFTSFDHFTNDPFKIFTLNKLDSGSKLFLLQHGHQYHHKFCNTFYELRVCDKYFTWGNKIKNKKSVPLYISTNVGKKINKKDASGILISFVEFMKTPWKLLDCPREIETYDIYKKHLFGFLNNLKKDVLNETTAKCYRPTDKKKFPNLEFDYISKDLKTKYKKIKYISTDKKKRGFEMSDKFKLLIETTNSTGFIESLSMNIPVILVTSKDFFTIKNEYKKYYESLLKNDLIFFDNIKAAKFVNSNLNNIEKWWFDKKRQKSINFFCKNMCKQEMNFEKSLDLMSKKIIN